MMPDQGKYGVVAQPPEHYFSGLRCVRCRVPTWRSKSRPCPPTQMVEVHDPEIRRRYPMINDDNPATHECEYPIKGVGLCMERAEGAVWSGFVDRVWLCKPHLTGEIAKGWERADV